MHPHYSFQECESQILTWWDHARIQGAAVGGESGKNPYTIIMPPPNVTGSLHLGHALSSTFQDILVRFYRMNGRDVLWVPGTDHAGIATQMMVEKEVVSQGTTRKELGRDAFVQRIWDWKDRYGSLIIEQIKRLGFSADWDRLCFTLDPAMNTAVNQAFVKLYGKGCVYRAQRLVNWDGHLKTALSDLEVVNKTVSGHLWHLRYDLVSDPNQGIVVATTRPETLFGDVAVVVHPDDPRYAHWIGEMVRIPLTGRMIPVIADSEVDPEKGTGAVKVTPAHDFTDFQIGQRHNLPIRSILTADNCLNDEVPLEFQGLDCAQARAAVLGALGTALVDQINITHSVPYSERSGAVVEPRVTLQWFIDMQPMASQAIAAIESGEMRFVPAEWTNNALHWLKTIQPWCVSRQLWWGHRLPVWYGPENSIFVATDSHSAYDLARKQWGEDVVLIQDEDVLDTWFSSGLWPFSTLGWPNNSPDMDNRLPTNVLVTGFDIIFFWVARMMMLGIELTGRVPFRDIYIHPLIRDAQGQKMSKTKQNVVNPLDIIQEYGADALRFALAGATCGKQHMRFSLKNVEQSQHFINKIWNIMRFAHGRGMMDCLHSSDAVLGTPQNIKDPVNQWMMGQVSRTLDEINAHIGAYCFTDAASAVYHFIWHVVCDWYVEWAKREWDHAQRGEEIQRTFLWVLGIMVRILHPFMPFITEKIWHDLTGQEGTLFQSPWPQCTMVDNAEIRAWSTVQDGIVLIRRVRSLFAIPPTLTLQVTLCGASPEVQSCIEAYQSPLCRWMGLSSWAVHSSNEGPTFAPNGVVFPMGGPTSLVIPLADAVDMSGALERLEKDLQKIEKEWGTLEKRLHEAQSRLQTPEEIVEDLQVRCQEKQSMLEHIRATILAITKSL
jgi:valyl-tRNA synthetase